MAKYHKRQVRKYAFIWLKQVFRLHNRFWKYLVIDIFRTLHKIHSQRLSKVHKRTVILQTLSIPVWYEISVLHILPLDSHTCWPVHQQNTERSSEPPCLNNTKLSALCFPAAQDIGAITFIQHPLGAQGSLEPNSSLGPSQTPNSTNTDLLGNEDLVIISSDICWQRGQASVASTEMF